MKLPAERAEALLEIGRVDVQLARQPEEREVVAVTAERQDLRALRTEVRVDGARRRRSCCVQILKRESRVEDA